MGKTSTAVAAGTVEITGDAVAPRASLERPLAEVLAPGEVVTGYAEGLMRILLQLFARCATVLTDRRLLIFTPKWPWGYGLEAEYPRETCLILNHKERMDGSRLVIVRHSTGVRCLYFPRSWRDGADAIRSALGPDLATAAKDYSNGLDALRQLGDLAEASG